MTVSCFFVFLQRFLPAGNEISLLGPFFVAERSVLGPFFGKICVRFWSVLFKFRSVLIIGSSEHCVGLGAAAHLYFRAITLTSPLQCV